MKDALIHILLPLLYFILERVLKGLKPLFCDEDECLRKVLEGKGFHPALCTHPSILYGQSQEWQKKVIGVSLQISYLSKAIHLGLLKTKQGHALMKRLGMVDCYGNGLEFWFIEKHTPMKPYALPNQYKPKPRIAIYTALTGDYDHVQEILYIEDGVDYLLFTNNRALRSKTWTIVYVESDLDDVLLSREIKMLPHKYLNEKYDESIYIDANAVIYGHLSDLTQYLDKNVSLAVSQHQERRSVREEIDAIVRLKSISAKKALGQYAKYVEDGFKDDMGLAECGILVRKHMDIELQGLMREWWKEFTNGIRRDQISLLPCISRLHFKAYSMMNGYVYHNQFCKIVSHKS